MGMQINTNIAANNTYRNLTATQNDMSKSLEKLSSGLRINRAADDAAGLAISEGLKSQVGGLTVASRNAQDGISVIQTAEGSLSEVQTILQRVRDLAVQAGNDSNNAKSRDAITTEVKQLTTEPVARPVPAAAGVEVGPVVTVPPSVERTMSWLLVLSTVAVSDAANVALPLRASATSCTDL